MSEYEITPKKEKTQLTLKQVKSLNNYIIIDKQNYNTISNSAFVRYINEDGKFVLGGQVITVSKTKLTKGSRDYWVIKPHNNKMNTYVVFPDTIKQLWKRIEHNVHPEFIELKKKIIMLDKYLINRDGQQYIDFINSITS